MLKKSKPEIMYTKLIRLSALVSGCLKKIIKNIIIILK